MAIYGLYFPESLTTAKNSYAKIEVRNHKSKTINANLNEPFKRAQ